MPDLLWIEIGGAVFALTSLAAWLRARRVRRLREFLQMPVHDALDKIPGKAKFLKNFPGLGDSKKSLSLREALDKTIAAGEKPVLALQLFEILSDPKLLPVQTMLPKLPDMPKIPELSDQKIQNIVTVPSYHDDPSLPVEMVATSVLSNLLKAFRGEKPLKMALEHAVLDSFGASGGFAGAKIAAMLAISATFAPWLVGLNAYWIPVFMVIGAAIGSIIGRKLANRLKERKFYATKKHLKNIASEFKKELLVRTPEMQLELEKDFVQRRASLKNISGSKLFPSLVSVWVHLSDRNIQHERKLSRKNWRRLRRRIKKLRFDDLDRLITRVGEKSLSPYPKLSELREKYNDTSVPS